MRFKETKLSEDNETTSDYASAETVNRLNEQSGLFGFCNPHYLGPDVQHILMKRNDDDARAQQVKNHCCNYLLSLLTFKVIYLYNA